MFHSNVFQNGPIYSFYGPVFSVSGPLSYFYPTLLFFHSTFTFYFISFHFTLLSYSIQLLFTPFFFLPHFFTIPHLHLLPHFIKLHFLFHFYYNPKSKSFTIPSSSTTIYMRHCNILHSPLSNYTLNSSKPHLRPEHHTKYTCTSIQSLFLYIPTPIFFHTWPDGYGHQTQY